MDGTELNSDKYLLQLGGTVALESVRVRSEKSEMIDPDIYDKGLRYIWFTVDSKLVYNRRRLVENGSKLYCPFIITEKLLAVRYRVFACYVE